MAEPNLDEPVNAARSQKGQFDVLFGQQRSETGDFLNRFRTTLSSQPTTAMMASRIGDELGLPTLRSNATMLRTTLANIPSTFKEGTRGFDVNANQLARTVGQKASELAPTVTAAENALSAAEADLTTRLGYEQRDQDRALIPFQAEQSLLSERLARETTGYTQAMQNELNALIAKMNAGVTLSEGEKNRANALAIAEKGYQQALEVAKIQNNRPFALANGQGVYNPANNSYQRYGWG